ncbi:lytic transglycosylase domain-containing protein [Rhizobium mayense]|uniref:Lytic transglycosylase domain-containing protein n=1 Tax=Rhizobium mayense TaxID=1312184 RepID=A0ABT7JNG4_9HYPH|nr:lytic transglycosylase domain-containing protein [Rhizobium mayense]MDL2397890.1 lytic transglycosylase domain-containing protein [Rhizobium mayense]
MAGNQHRPSLVGKATNFIIAFGFVVVAACPASAQPEWSVAPPACISGPLVTKTGKTLCIRKESYNRDLCDAIDYFARANHLPPDYLARLIWRESTFRPDAVSPKGAQGIAQFMPGTARLRGVQDSYDLLEALGKAAAYLDELRNRFGNLGLAAAAYNAGENGLANFLSSGNLPYETRSYVIAITAHTVEQWKDDPPDTVALELDKGKPFAQACMALAGSRKLKQIALEQERPWAPWGAQLAENLQLGTVRDLFSESVAKLPAPLSEEKPLIVRQRNADFGFRIRYAARIGRQTRAEADAVCTQVRQNGGACLVFKN